MALSTIPCPVKLQANSPTRGGLPFPRRDHLLRFAPARWGWMNGDHPGNDATTLHWVQIGRWRPEGLVKSSENFRNFANWKAEQSL
jgi:hypothetical protein